MKLKVMATALLMAATVGVSSNANAAVSDIFAKLNLLRNAVVISPAAANNPALTTKLTAVNTQVQAQQAQVAASTAAANTAATANASAVATIRAVIQQQQASAGISDK
ncbi:hypothetical protein J9253_13105 [Thiothrix litoralis]|uniref:Uncharacterized protein n=1 Tax=Thiothrix litoralis TaxID=2891210 RepID=A0ABX7WRY6_9GAMM|nr:hypothetical protein [Thiothrix litoralis]QTR44948.1 hypothetical protein J9253_13105 [Thiothrix litoralis]